jgi:hypothetical protein
MVRPDVRTPNIDRLGAQGMLFTTMRANCTVCSPSRAALLTGRYANRVGVPGVIRTKPEDSWGYFNPKIPTIADELKKAGYQTALVGKWHLGLEAPNLPNERGFDFFHGFLGDMMDSYTTHLRHGINYMRRNAEVIEPKGHATDLFSDWAIQKGEMAGYLLVPNEKVPETYNAGFSMYVAAWPLLDQYPGQRFQTGLFGTWMFARNEPPPPIKLYSDIEGGLGWWRDTEFATETPKFIMGGVAPNFSEWANGPGAGKGRDWAQPKGKYGVAQLSPWLLWPPDGLNLKQGTCGELFGYGYLPLPLTPAKPPPPARTSRPGINPGRSFSTRGISKARWRFSPPTSGPPARSPSRASVGCSWIAVPPIPTGPCRWRPSMSPAFRPLTPRVRLTPALPRLSFPVKRTANHASCITSPPTTSRRSGMR